MENKIDITPKTTINEILTAMPFLEDKLIEISPVFAKLKNPVLRRTVGKVATVQQAAAIASISTVKLVNELRKAAGLTEMELKDEPKKDHHKPNWVNDGKIVVEYNAGPDIEQGMHPAAKIKKETADLKEGEIYKLITPFVPVPLINILKDNGMKVFNERISETEVFTYVSK